MRQMSRKQALAITNEMLDEMCLPDDKKTNQAIMLKVLERYGLVPAKVKEEQIVGQMSITDFPEYCPDNNNNDEMER